MIGLTRAAKGREDIELPYVEAMNTEDRPAQTVKVFADAGDAGEYFEWSRVHIRTLCGPRPHYSVNVISAIWHHPIIGVWQTRGAFYALRLGVTAARQPLELLGLGSNPGGGATVGLFGHALAYSCQHALK